MNLLIKGAKICDLEKKEFVEADILIAGEKIKRIGKNLKADAKLIDAKGLYCFPGFVDLHTHVREPGAEYKENISTLTRSASKGGFTSLLCMPNTQICLDTPEKIRSFLKIAKSSDINIFVCGAITKERKGKELTEMFLMKREGALAFSDDGSWVEDSFLFLMALRYAKFLNTLIITHAEEKSLSQGVCREGRLNIECGFFPNYAISETIAILRDLEIAKYTGVKLHIAHVSTKRGVVLIERAKKEGIKVSCEATPHHLILNFQELSKYDPNFKVNPPLGSEEDRKELIKALKKDIIDCIATDHAPHTKEEKLRPFSEANPGVIGLESCFSALYTYLVDKGYIDIFKLVEKLTLRPAQILGLKTKGLLKEGLDADLVLIDLDEECVFTEKEIESRCKNSPFLGRNLKAKVKFTISKGKIVYKE